MDHYFVAQDHRPERNPTVMAMSEGRRIQITGWYVDLHGHQALLCSGDRFPGCPHTDGLAMWRFLGESRLSTPSPAPMAIAA